MGESVFSTTWVYTGDDSTAVAKDTQQLGTVTFRSVKGIPEIEHSGVITLEIRKRMSWKKPYMIHEQSSQDHS